jgi:hypothetical protein
LLRNDKKPYIFLKKLVSFALFQSTTFAFGVISLKNQYDMYDPTVNNEKEHAPASQPSQANALAHVELGELRAAHVSSSPTLASRDTERLGPTTSVHKGLNLFLGLSLYISKRTDDCWKSRSVIASVFGVSLQVIDLVNRSVRDSLLDSAGKRASANLKTVLLSNIIESQPRQAHTYMPFLLDGSCQQRYALASRLVSQFSKSFIIDNFVHCTPSKFGIADQVLQQRLYAEIFHSSLDERQSCILQPQDTLAISKFDREYFYPAYRNNLSDSTNHWFIVVSTSFPSKMLLRGYHFSKPCMNYLRSRLFTALLISISMNADKRRSRS